MNHLAPPYPLVPAVLLNQKQTNIPSLFDVSLAPPHALIESDYRYSVVFNMLGVKQKEIGIDVDVEKREITVRARKNRENFRQGFYWVFGVPVDARLSRMSVRFKAGVLEIGIPKCSVAITA